MERVARVFCADDGHDPDELDADGDPRWRAYVDVALSAIVANRVLTR